MERADGCVPFVHFDSSNNELVSAGEELGEVIFILEFLARAFVNKTVRRVMASGKKMIIVFDPPDGCEVCFRKVDCATAVKIFGRQYDIAGINSSEVTSELAEKPAVPGMPVLILALENPVEERLVFDSPELIFQTPFGEISVAGSSL